MIIALVFPPAADPTQPYSSLPALAAALDSQGWQEVHQLDLNIDFYRAFLCREGLERALLRIDERLVGKYPVSAGLTVERSASVKDRLIRAMLAGSFVLDEVESAVADLRRVECYRDPERLDHDKRTLFDALEIILAASDPIRLDSMGATASRISSATDIAAALDEPGNLIHEYLEAEAIPRLKRLKPDAIGISLTYPGQIGAAFALARLVRRTLADTKVILGGQLISLWYKGLDACPELFDWCHYIIAFEGETALNLLLRAFDEPGRLASVPNLVYRSGDHVIRNPMELESVENLPVPDYRGLPLDKYLTPEPVFLLSASRGCYWGRCAFCSVSPAMRGSYRVRSIEVILRDIAMLVERHGARYLSFGDDCLSPALLRRLACHLPDLNYPLAWQGETRFEEALTTDLLRELRRAGCVNLVFGLESYSPRVLKRMGKGVDHGEIGRILDDCRRFGLAFNLQLFFGFPGETAEDAECTFNFVVNQAHGAATFSFGVFALMRGSGVDQNPETFGIKTIDRSRGCLAVSFDHAPAASHARAMRERLREAIRQRARYPHLGLSLTAQTLVFFAEATQSPDLYDGKGIEPAEMSGMSMSGTNMLETAWVADREFLAIWPDRELEVPGQAFWGQGSGRQEEGLAALIYNRRNDRLIRASRLALWLLYHLDGTITPAQLWDQVMGEAGADEEELLRIKETLTGIVRELASRGFLTAAPSRVLFDR